MKPNIMNLHLSKRLVREHRRSWWQSGVFRQGTNENRRIWLNYRENEVSGDKGNFSASRHPRYMLTYTQLKGVLGVDNP